VRDGRVPQLLGLYYYLLMIDGPSPVKFAFSLDDSAGNYRERYIYIYVRGYVSKMVSSTNNILSSPHATFGNNFSKNINLPFGYLV
jgi:hypothetical protein